MGGTVNSNFKCMNTYYKHVTMYVYLPSPKFGGVRSRLNRSLFLQVNIVFAGYHILDLDGLQVMYDSNFRN